MTSIECLPAQTVRIDYTNWKGVRRWRDIVPIKIEWGTSTFHTSPQWLLEAYDPEDNQVKWFAMKDVHAWVQA